MYSVSQTYLEKSFDCVQEHDLRGTIGSISFNRSNIIANTFSIRNQCSDRSDIKIGSVIIGELSCTFTGINLARGQWKNKIITPTFYLKIGDNTWESVPLGVFKVKEAKHTAEGVEVTAYDNMHKFDKSFKRKRFKYSGTMYQFLNDICTRCGVTLGMATGDVQALTNGTESRKIYGLYKDQAANDIKTFRDLLSYIAQATCTFATIDRSGALVLRPFGGEAAVDTISDSMRLSGAEFEDFETKYNGIFVNDMDTGDEVYYGYDPDNCADMLTNLTAELEDNVTSHTNLENEHDAGKISDSDYAQQKLVLDKEATRIQYRMGEVTDWNTYRTEHPEVAEGSSIILGDNPLLQSDNITYRDVDRTNILAAAMEVAYTPFTCSLVCGAHYDLGDVIEFTNGHAGTSTTCCVMGWEYNLNAENSLEGYGSDPDIANVHSLARKKASVAIKDYNDTKVEVHNNYDETNGLEIGTVSVNGDPKSLYQQRDQTHLEKLNDGSIVVRDERLTKGAEGSQNTKVFWCWAQNDLVVEHQSTYAILDICIKCTNYNFIVVDYPIGISGQAPRIANIDGKNYYESMVTLVVKTKRNDPPPIWKELNTFHKGNRTQSNQVGNRFVPNAQYGSWATWEDTQTPTYVGDYAYYRRGWYVGSTYSGLYGMCRADKHYPDETSFMNDFTAGNINPPDTKNGDVILPTNTTQEETRDALQGLANAVSGASGDAYDTETMMQVNPDSTTDVISENNAKTAASAINQIKEGIKNWVGSVVDKGRGEIIATVVTREGAEGTNIHASTNLVTVGTEPVVPGFGEPKDLHCVIADPSGLGVEQSYIRDWTLSFLRATQNGYWISLNGQMAEGVVNYSGREILKIDGLTAGQQYTFTYKVRGLVRLPSGVDFENIEYLTIEGQRVGKYGVLFHDATAIDESTIPGVGSSSYWDAAIQWQNFPDIQSTDVSFTNVVTATASTMYAHFYLEPIKKYEDKVVIYSIIDFKTAEMDLSFCRFFVKGEDDVWYEFNKGEGTVNYEVLENKPQINSVTLTGNKTSSDLGIVITLTQAQYDALSTAEKNDPNKVYYITDAGGGGGGGGAGTTVVANPSGEATDTLNKLQVGSTIYGVSGGGGSSYSKTLLWGNIPFTYPATQVADAELSADIGEFDDIQIIGGWTSGNVLPFRDERFDAKILDTLETATTDLSKQFVMVMNPYVQNGAQYSQWIRISKGSADNIIHFRYNNAVGVYAIFGIKY